MSNPRAPGPSLADVDRALANNGLLSPTRRRDLRSAISRVAALLGEDPARLPLDLAAIAGRLAAINPGRRRAHPEDAEQYPLRLVGRGADERAPAGAGFVQGRLVAAMGRLAGATSGQARPHRPLPACPLCQRRRHHPRRDQRPGHRPVHRRHSPRLPAPQSERAAPEDRHDLERGRQCAAAVWGFARSRGPRSALPPSGSWATLTEEFRADVDKYLRLVRGRRCLCRRGKATAACAADPKASPQSDPCGGNRACRQRHRPRVDHRSLRSGHQEHFRWILRTPSRSRRAGKQLQPRSRRGLGSDCAGMGQG